MKWLILTESLVFHIAVIPIQTKIHIHSVIRSIYSNDLFHTGDLWSVPLLPFHVCCQACVYRVFVTVPILLMSAGLVFVTKIQLSKY